MAGADTMPPHSRVLRILKHPAIKILIPLLIAVIAVFILPFVIAAAGLGLIMGMARRGELTGGAQMIWRAFHPLVPPVAAGIALLAGVLLLISGNLPAEQSHLGVLRELLPLSFVEASHLTGSIAGLLLIVVARGLYRKLYRAWLMAMGLLAIGLVASMLKWLDWKESLSMLATLAVLGLFRPAFYRADGASVFRLNRTWIASIVALMATVSGRRPLKILVAYQCMRCSRKRVRTRTTQNMSGRKRPDMLIGITTRSILMSSPRNF